jgi:hypothetical protein
MIPATEQLSLLDQPRARHTDPATSRAAAVRVAPSAGALATAIVAALARAGEPITAPDIADRVTENQPGRWDRGTVLSAVSRARTAGLIVPAGTRLTPRSSEAAAYTLPENGR